MVPLPDPGLVTEHQLWSEDAVHPEFEVTVKEVDPAADVTGWFEGVTESVGAAPAWLTVTVIGVKPVTVTVMVATLAARVLTV